MKKKVEFEIIEEGPIYKKTESAGVRINLMSIGGQEMIDIRQVYRTRDADDWLPSAKGFTLPPDKAAKVLKAFLKFVKELGE